MDIKPVNEFESTLGGTKQAKYLTNYLLKLDAKICILEEEYIDRDYMIDFQLFYCRSFKPESKFTERLHFFSIEVTPKKFLNALEENDTKFHDELQDSYLGFVVVKPIKDNEGRKLIGRTFLKTYPCQEKDIFRQYLRIKETVSLYGLQLEVKSVPFQTQDQRVSACATVALWTALHVLKESFDVPELSPAEITEIATAIPSMDRRFPQERGLNANQMINCIRSTGLDVEIIDVQGFPSFADHVISTAVRAYLEMDIPLIAHIELKIVDNNRIRTDYHAAVITGYQSDQNGNITELYIHDDQIGPYSKALPDKTLQKWKNEWNDIGYYQIKLEFFSIPIYTKLRLSFRRIYHELLKVLHKRELLAKQMKEQGEEPAPDFFDVNLHLNTIQQYKKVLLASTISEKTDILTKSFPRFLWIISIDREGKKAIDIVFDGTAAFPKICEVVLFD